MKRRRFLIASSTLLANQLLSGTFSQSAIAANKPLIMGIFPRRNIKLTYEIFTPLANFLGDILEREVKLVTTKSFKQFWQGVKQKQYDLVHYNQYHYILSHELYGYNVILKNQEFGSDTVAGSIVVRKDSDFKSIKDLQGKTILFGGGKTAMQSYICAKWLLQNGGLENGSYIEKFALNPPNAIISTYHKQADAAGSGDVIIKLDIVTKNIDTSKMQYLARTRQLTHLPWAVSPGVSEETKQKIQETLSQLNQTSAGRNLLSKAKLSSLSVSQDIEYERHREIIRDVYGYDYGINQFK